MRNPNLLEQIGMSDLQRYFLRPAHYAGLRLQEYFEKLALYNQNKHPKKYQDMEPLPPLDSGDPAKYVTERLPGAEDVSRVRWIRPGRTADFALRKILIEVLCLSYRDARTVGSIVYLTFRAAAVARGLYADGQEFELAMAQAIGIQSTQEELGRLFVMCYQEGENPFALYEQFIGAMMADIPEGTESARTDELLKRLHRISERHRGKIS